MMGDRNCNTTESERGISCTEQYSKEMEVKLHKPRTTSIVCLQQVLALNMRPKGNVCVMGLIKCRTYLLPQRLEGL